MVGLDVSLSIQRTLYQEFREPGFAPALLLEHLVTAGYLGRKTGKGFRDDTDRWPAHSTSGAGGVCVGVSFDEFVAARLPALLRYAVLLTGDRDLAQDLVQDVLVRAYGRWRRIAAADHPERYVHRMITNGYLSWRRRWSTRQVVLVDPPDRAAPAEDPVDRAERDELWRRLAELPRQQRAVLVLRYYEGLSVAETADVLGCSTGAVRGYASRALATLRVEAAELALNPGDQR